RAGAGLPAGASGPRDRELYQYVGRGEGRERYTLYVEQRGEGRELHSAGEDGAVSSGSGTGGLRPTGGRGGEYEDLAGVVHCACDLSGSAASGREGGASGGEDRGASGVSAGGARHGGLCRVDLGDHTVVRGERRRGIYRDDGERREVFARTARAGEEI